MPTEAKSKRLSDTQLAILIAAAGRDDGNVLPTPSSLQTKGAALKQVQGTQLKAGPIAGSDAPNGITRFRGI